MANLNTVPVALFYLAVTLFSESVSAEDVLVGEEADDIRQLPKWCNMVFAGVITFFFCCCAHLTAKMAISLWSLISLQWFGELVEAEVVDKAMKVDRADDERVNSGKYYLKLSFPAVDGCSDENVVEKRVQVKKETHESTNFGDNVQFHVLDRQSSSGLAILSDEYSGRMIVNLLGFIFYGAFMVLYFALTWPLLIAGITYSCPLYLVAAVQAALGLSLCARAYLVHAKSLRSCDAQGESSVKPLNDCPVEDATIASEELSMKMEP